MLFNKNDEANPIDPKKIAEINMGFKKDRSNFNEYILFFSI